MNTKFRKTQSLQRHSAYGVVRRSSAGYQGEMFLHDFLFAAGSDRSEVEKEVERGSPSRGLLLRFDLTSTGMEKAGLISLQSG